ncbi:MAG: CPBP family intramembrane glutamic endopeptidase, partial [Cyanobacteria bacterium J06632_3]
TSLAATSGVATSVETKSSETKSSETKSVGIAKFYQRYPRLIFYVLTLLFGAIHITNYTPEALPLLPLLVLPQVILGLLLGFVRLRYGFLWAILLHSFHNSCVLLPIAVLKIFGSASFQSQGLEGDVEALPMADQLLMGGVGLYTLGGLVLCLIVSWKMLKELKRA